MQQCIDFYFIFVIKWIHRIEKSLLSKCGSKMWNNIMLVEEFIKKKLWISRYIVSQISLENYFRGNRTQIQRKKDILQIMTLVWYMLNIDVNVVNNLWKYFIILLIIECVFLQGCKRATALGGSPLLWLWERPISFTHIEHFPKKRQGQSNEENGRVYS